MAFKYFQAISGAEKGEPAAMLLSPSSSIPIAGADVSRSPCGSLFTIFLTAPLQAFCLLLGVPGSEIEMVCRCILRFSLYCQLLLFVNF